MKEANKDRAPAISNSTNVPAPQHQRPVLLLLPCLHHARLGRLGRGLLALVHGQETEILNALLMQRLAPQQLCLSYTQAPNQRSGCLLVRGRVGGGCCRQRCVCVLCLLCGRLCC